LERRKEAKQVALFTALDVDSDGKITIVEMKTFKEFDSDNNGEVSDDEAKVSMLVLAVRECEIRKSYACDRFAAEPGDIF
uniref:EF-hand domain-containing protein n=1 Tax=Anisakis simplex TaxID=6269 RepID=A0A0M3KJT6_ANISI